MGGEMISINSHMAFIFAGAVMLVVGVICFGLIVRAIIEITNLDDAINDYPEDTEG
jgi:hypothetical protein